MPETTLIAHRGMEDTHPENTLPAFEAALNLGMGVEFDLAMTADDQLIVVHDDTVDRTTDGSGRVTEMDLADLRKLDAGSWKGEQFAGTRIPTFEEALDVIASYNGISPAIALHIMALQPGVINRVCGALAERGLLDRTVGIGLVSQSVDVRRRFYEGSPDFQCSALAETADTLPIALRDPYSNWIYARFVPTEADVASVREAGKKILVSGDAVSGDVQEAKRAVAAGPDAVLTWHPTELHKLVKS